MPSDVCCSPRPACPHLPPRPPPPAQFDMTFAHMPCSWMSVDVMDVSGESQLDVVRPPAGGTGQGWAGQGREVGAGRQAETLWKWISYGWGSQAGARFSGAGVCRQGPRCIAAFSGL